VALRGADRIAVDALGADAPAATALDRVVDAEHDRADRHEGGDQQELQQQVACRTGVPDGTAEHTMVVDEPPLPVEPNDPQQAGHRALAGREDGTDQQPFGTAPRSLLPGHRREG
jgi:hypothetical protein